MLQFDALKRLFLFWFLIFPTLLPVSAVADHAAEAERQPAVFVIPEVWPWGYEDRHGRPAGTLVELAHRLVSLAGVPIEYELRPHRRAIAEIVQGESDFVVLFESPAIGSVTIDLGTVVRTQVLLTARADSMVDLSLEGLAGRSVAYVHGTFYGKEFEQADEITKIPVRDIFQATEMLKLGRVDAILCSDQALYRTLKSLDVSPESFRVAVFREGQEGHLYMSRKARHPELRDELVDALEQLRESGELDSIFRLPRE